MKYNKYEEVTKTESISIKELEKSFKIFRILTFLVVIIALTISIACMKLSLENEALKIENNELNKVVEMQKSIISDLQEDNMKLQEMIK